MANQVKQLAREREIEAIPPDNALVVEPDVTRLFGKADIDHQGLIAGWSPSEDGHNWNDGKDATLLLWSATPPNEPCSLTIEGAPFLPKGIKAQQITLYVNGFRLGFWTLTDLQSSALTAVIEPEHWFARAGGGLLKIVWHLPDSVKPSDVGAASDERELGFCFRTMAYSAN